MKNAQSNVLNLKKIDEISTGELIEELSKRCLAMLFIGLKPEEGTADGYYYKIEGTNVQRSGMLTELDFHISKAREDIDDGE